MPKKFDILITGTGFLAERVAFDLAVVAEKPIEVAVCGRHPEEKERLEWLGMAANARAALFARPVNISTLAIDWSSPAAIAETVTACEPEVILHTATLQSPWEIDRSTPWARLVERAGGFGVTGVLQALLAVRTAQAMRLAGNRGALVNTCYPDLVNQILGARNLPVTCGLGNVAILAAFLMGDLGIREHGRLKMLAHHQNLLPFRQPPAERKGTSPRVWVDGEEIEDVYGRFTRVKLPHKPMTAVAGTTGVPALLALAGHHDHYGNLPGPRGLPGGYPVAIKNRSLMLDLPAGETPDDAVAWNRQFESLEGMWLAEGGRIVYSERARAEIAAHSPTLGKGFHVDDLEEACAEMEAIRRKLGGETDRGGPL